MYAKLSRRLRLFFERSLGTKKITSPNEMIAYLRGKFSSIAGYWVMGYSKKALGRKHYLWIGDKTYTKVLIQNQVKMHYKISKDLFPYIFPLLVFATKEKELNFRRRFLRLHADFAASAPKQYNIEPILTDADLTGEKIPLNDLAYDTGKYLFKSLPMTDMLYDSNIEIFSGQVLHTYINFQSKLNELVQTNNAFGSFFDAAP